LDAASLKSRISIEFDQERHYIIDEFRDGELREAANEQADSHRHRRQGSSAQLRWNIASGIQRGGQRPYANRLASSFRGGFDCSELVISKAEGDLLPSSPAGCWSTDGPLLCEGLRLMTILGN